MLSWFGSLDLFVIFGLWCYKLLVFLLCVVLLVWIFSFVLGCFDNCFVFCVWCCFMLIFLFVVFMWFYSVYWVTLLWSWLVLFAVAFIVYFVMLFSLRVYLCYACCVLWCGFSIDLWFACLLLGFSVLTFTCFSLGFYLSACVRGYRFVTFVLCFVDLLTFVVWYSFWCFGFWFYWIDSI